MADQITRRAVLDVGLDWIDTPYQHQASVKGVGTDCLGLIRGVWRELYSSEPSLPPNYTPDWGDESGEELLLGAARKWLQPISNQNAQPGDVVLFRMTPQAPCKHIAILSAPDRILHAYWGKAVIESFFVPFWRKRWEYSFVFPPLK